MRRHRTGSRQPHQDAGRCHARAAFSSFDQSDHFAPIEPIQRGNEVPIVEHVDQPID
jgi:hypothetical protein